MVQFYFLSVLMNLIAGLVLVYGLDLTKASEEEVSGGKGFIASAGLNGHTARLVIGIASLVVAVMKILSVFRKDLPVIGDLLPVAAGLAGGFSLLVEYFKVRSESVDVPESVQKIFIDSRKYIGILCLAASVLHFVLPQVPLL